MSHVERQQAPEPLWDCEQVAKYLSCTPGQVRRLATAGLLPGSKIGKYWRFVPSQIIAWAERGGMLQHA
jgi:excisionase family DNA binding protein